MNTIINPAAKVASKQSLKQIFLLRKCYADITELLFLLKIKHRLIQKLIVSL